MENDSRKPEGMRNQPLNKHKTIVVHQLPVQRNANENGVPQEKRLLQGRLKGTHRIVYSLN